MEISILHKKLYQNCKYKKMIKKQYQNYKTSISKLLWESVWVNKVIKPQFGFIPSI